MPSRYRFIFGILSILSFLSSAYILLISSLKVDSSSGYYSIIVTSAISGLNIAILLAWLSFEITGGAASLAIVVILSWFFNAKTGFYDSMAFAFQFLFAFAIGYLFYYIRNSDETSYSLRSEKVGEEVTELASTISERRKGTVALQNKFSRYSALRGVVESFSTILSIDEINSAILDKALETLGKKGRALLYLVDEDRQELMLSASRNEERIKAKKGDIFDQWVLRHRRSLIVEDVSRDFRFPAEGSDRSEGEPYSLIASPLISEDKVIGVLRMDCAEPFFYNQDDLRLLDIIANLGAVAIQNIYLYSKTQELAIRDGLTGLFVRRYFMDRFSAELKRAAGKRGELAVLIIDIDHFKDYNDKYGHTAGDIVLKHLSRIVRSMVKDGDIVARYGGEEIIAVLLDRDKNKAIADAEAIRSAVSEEPFSLRRHETKITVSIGVAEYPKDAATEDGLVEVADDCLYKAKRRGRNRVCST
ncbi:MAG: sensor domain-containing diguanylate cyclase [Candidatus Omnitrophica bacterium]|nr:sensor domain-containing diguanylate cyclase [Candidatus Omnitrophota bacterium]